MEITHKQLLIGAPIGVIPKKKGLKLYVQQLNCLDSILAMQKIKKWKLILNFTNVTSRI